MQYKVLEVFNSRPLLIAYFAEPFISWYPLKPHPMHVKRMSSTP
jgi:hypothetical protein